MDRLSVPIMILSLARSRWSWVTVLALSLAANNAVGTLARGAGAVASGFLYDTHGITGPAILSAVAAGLAVALLVWGSRS